MRDVRTLRNCALDAAGQSLMKSAMRKSELQMSARRHAKRTTCTFGLVRTIADLTGSNMINVKHLAEALHRRSAEETGSMRRCASWGIIYAMKI